MIKDMSDEALVEHYWSLRALAYNASQLKSRKLGYLLRQLDITVAIARQRGVSLAR